MGMVMINDSDPATRLLFCGGATSCSFSPDLSVGLIALARLLGFGSLSLAIW